MHTLEYDSNTIITLLLIKSFELLDICFGIPPWKEKVKHVKKNVKNRDGRKQPHCYAANRYVPKLWSNSTEVIFKPNNEFSILKGLYRKLKQGYANLHKGENQK